MDVLEIGVVIDFNLPAPIRHCELSDKHCIRFRPVDAYHSRW